MNDSYKSGLFDAPVLIEIQRGEDKNGSPIVDCLHRGIIAIVSGSGEQIYQMGDTEALVHMRSSAKPFQILPLFELGIFDPKSPAFKPDLRPADIPLLMSSHAGQSIHTSRVQSLLDLMGLDELALRCGIHPPQDEDVRQDLQKTKQKSSALHNNCSGKHVAMLMACLERGYDMGTYEDYHHPLQQWIKSLIAQVSDLPEEDVRYGTDGCSLPSWAIPLEKIALMYARLVSWSGGVPPGKPSFLKDAFASIVSAALHYPDYLAGANRFDTELIKQGKGQIVSKTGADGMLAVSIMPTKKFPHGLGIAIKVADGDAKQTIRPLIVKELLTMLDLWPQGANLDRFMPSFTNWRGLTTGSYASWL